MSAEIKIKCAFYNIGHCTTKLQGCKHQHPEEEFSEQKCSDKGCPRRHKIYCKFRNKRKFHKENKFDLNHTKENIEGRSNLGRNKVLENKIKMLQDVVVKKDALIKEKDLEIKNHKDALKKDKSKVLEKENRYKKKETEFQERKKISKAKRH